MDPKLAAAIDRFVADPDDLRAFESLEEHHFLHGEWPELVKLYERRLEARSLENDAQARAQLCFRLGQVHEERCLQVDRALEHYRESARLAPDFRAPLVQLRRIYAARESWDLVLQVAELEAELPMQTFERAAFCAQMGEIWHERMGDAQQGRIFYERALEADPNRLDALVGLARVRDLEGDPQGAAAALEQVVERTEGPDAARPLLALARLHQGPLDDEARAEALYRRALASDPRCEEALFALTEMASVRESWPQVAELLERRFHLAAGATRRLAIAHDAGRLALEQLRDVQAARLWLGRALELFPQDPVTLLLLAEVEELAGRPRERAAYLERAIAAAPDAVPVDVIVELASARADAGELESALADLERALDRAPTHPAALEAAGRMLERVQRYDAAASIQERRAGALAGDAPAAAAAWMACADLRERRLGDLEAGCAAYRSALEAQPGLPEAEDALVRLHTAAEQWDAARDVLRAAADGAEGRRRVLLEIRLGELLFERFEDAEGARVAFQAALDVDGSEPRALQGLERIALASGDEDAILDAFEREAAVTTDRARLSFLVWELVRIFERREQPDEALLWIERLVPVAPEDTAVLETCARLQQELGHTEELADSLERLDALLQGTAQAANRRRMGELWTKAGETERAVAAYRSALEADPEDQAALRALLGPLEHLGEHAALADVHAELAELTEGPERVASLVARATLLETRLDDAPGAIAALERLAREDGAPGDVEERLAELLERAGRFEELVARLAERRRTAGATEAAALDLRRAELLLERLGRPGEAAPLFTSLEESASLDEDARRRARTGLEQALRRGGDLEALAELLERKAEAAEPATAAALHLERAGLLEELGRLEPARALYESLAEGDGAGADEVARAAEGRVVALLERNGAFDALCRRLEGRLPALEGEARADALEEVAKLRRDRLGDRTGALAHLEEAAALAPDRAPIWRTLARLYEEDDRPEDLLRALEAELATAPDAARRHLLHARAAELARGVLGDASGAAEHFRAILEIEPGNVRAAEFLIAQLEREERFDELAELLEARLARALEAPAAERADREIALRLRLAALRGGPLEDPAAAIEVLRPAFEGRDARALVAEPLADLYQRRGDREAVIEVCRGAVDVLDGPGERAGWSLRLGDALAAIGRLEEAAESYQRVLVDRTDDRDAEAALRDLYRRLDRAEPLARLLDAQLQTVGGAEEVPIRLELAALLGDTLERPGEALVHLRRVLEIEPAHADAMERALELARRLERPEDLLQLLDASLRTSRSLSVRAARLCERARVLAEPLGRAEEAIGSYREAIRLAPGDRSARVELRALLEARGDVPKILEALEAEAAMLPANSRPALYERAARLAEEQLPPGASLPWLHRLAVAHPGSADVRRRIVDVHRALGEPEGLIASLRALVPQVESSTERAALHVELAALYEEDERAPGSAIRALEAARAEAPGDPAVLAGLDRLYAATERHRERAEVLDARAATLAPDEIVAHVRERARLHRDYLGEGDRAAELLFGLLGAARGVERIDLLRELALSLRSAGRPDLWARATEEELRSLDARDPVFAERRLELHGELARAYERRLARPDLALPHWRALVEASASETATLEEAEERLLAGLRAERSDVELARRLEDRLARTPERVALWLELARLQEERLQRPERAADAYREVLERDADALEALRGLRRTCERLGRLDEVAATLERELAEGGERAPHETAALWRRLGEICWRHLDSTTRASRAFASALEADPGDLVSLRALETLFEAMEDWRGAADLYESEVAVLGDREPERRQEAWLRCGRLAAERIDDDERALRAYEAAAELGSLPPERRAEWAELYDRTGDAVRFVEVFADWCDDDASGAGVADHLRLARSLEALERPDDALARLERATAIDATCGEAWDELARLRDEADDDEGAARALERAAGCRQGSAAATRLLEAALRVADAAPERAFDWLTAAVSEDPAHAPAQAVLARVAQGLERGDVAKRAALCAADLRAAGSELEERDALEAFLAGADAARRESHLEPAIRLLRAAVAIDDDHADAWTGLAEALAEVQDWPAARTALERRLALPLHGDEAGSLTALLGLCLDRLGQEPEALERYREALAREPGLDLAHAGLCDVLERTGLVSDAVDALQNWALRTDAPELRAERLLRAAALELGRGDRDEPAEALLREATSLAPAQGAAWVQLAALLGRQGRTHDALEVATRGLGALDEGAPERADLAEARAAALEQRGERAEAAAAYGEALDADPSRTDAALAAARLLRAEGHWREAAGKLEAFLATPRDDGTGGLALAWLQLGRLRAGPLEDVDGAIAAYRHALEVDETLAEAREALAELLVHVRDGHDEAVSRHRDLLAEDPARVGSVRALVELARRAERADAVTLGCTVLAALGVATPEERDAIRGAPALPAPRQSALGSPAFEAARRVAREAAREIGEALGVGMPGEPPPEAADPVARFRAATLAQEADLLAPALVPLPSDEVGRVIALVAQLACDADAVAGDGNLVNDLSQRLGRRARRRARKALGDVALESLEAIDWDAWRAELRGLAAARALEGDGFDLRTALVSWLGASEGEVRALPESADLTGPVRESPECRALLGRIVDAWSARL